MKIAMITPGLLSVPAVKSGVVEVLIQYLIDQNEYNNTVDIDLFAVADDKYDLFKYNNTKIVSVSPGLHTKLINKVCNVLFKVLRIRKWIEKIELVKTLHMCKVYNYLVDKKYIGSIAYRGIKKY